VSDPHPGPRPTDRRGRPHLPREKESCGVVIGRFPFALREHVAGIERALDECDRVVVVIRAAFHPRIPRDPFTWQERAQMLRSSLAPAAGGRVTFIPARDQSDDARWAREVRAAVQAASPSASKARLYVEGSPAWACPEFDGWTRMEGDVGNEHAASRHLAMILQASSAQDTTPHDTVDAALERAAAVAASSALQALREWTRGAEFPELCQEQQALDRDRAQWRSAPYEPIFSTVDCVTTCAGHVLLVKRKHRPGAGLWALPGGFVEPRESLRSAALRELREETGIDLDERALRGAVREARVFDHPDRSQRGRSITHAHLIDLGHRELPKVEGSDDAAQAAWIPIASLASLEMRLFEDHFQILDAFLALTAKPA
jgi:bifunctional NMN adenylyltransferase/nudix hydrolase